MFGTKLDRPVAELMPEQSGFERYEALAAEVGLENGGLREGRLIRVLQKLEIRIYPLQQVRAYLHKMRGMNNFWCWKALRKKDGQVVRCNNWMSDGAVWDKIYQGRVPAHALEMVLRIEAELPTGYGFFVSDYEAVRPDPFLMVCGAGTTHYVIDAWDEPGFGV